MVRARRLCGRIICACVVAHCGGAVAPVSSGDASTGELADGAGGEPGNGNSDASMPGPIEFGDAAEPPTPRRDAGVPPPPLDAGDPPAQACSDDGGGGGCSIPRSVCADDRWLVYYVGGACVGGFCHWEKRFLLCRDVCLQGGCRGIVTAPVPR